MIAWRGCIDAVPEKAREADFLQRLFVGDVHKPIRLLAELEWIVEFGDGAAFEGLDRGDGGSRRIRRRLGGRRIRWIDRRSRRIGFRGVQHHPAGD